MKRFLLVTIIGFVLTALAAIGGPQPLASPAAPAKAVCDCSNLEVLQIELRNAIRLQAAFRKFSSNPELRRENVATSKNMLSIFAAGEARRGIETVPNYNGPKEYEYVSWGETQDVDYIKASKTMAEICDFSPSSKELLEAAKEASACAGIGAALQAHEDWHRNFCERIGYRPYLIMHGADRAREEAEAYGVQIAVLRAEIAEHITIRIEYEGEVRAQWPPNPAITAEIITTRGDVTMSRVSPSGDLIKLDGEGKHTTNATLEGHCRFTGGLPIILTARGSIETDGLEAHIRLTTEGASPMLKAQCTIKGQTGTGWTMPVNLISSGNTPVISLPLKNGAEKVFDQATGEGARILTQAGIKLSGQVKIRLILCEQSK